MQWRQMRKLSIFIYQTSNDDASRVKVSPAAIRNNFKTEMSRRLFHLRIRRYSNCTCYSFNCQSNGHFSREFYLEIRWVIFDWTLRKWGLCTYGFSRSDVIDALNQLWVIKEGPAISSRLTEFYWFQVWIKKTDEWKTEGEQTWTLKSFLFPASSPHRI